MARLLSSVRYGGYGGVFGPVIGRREVGEGGDGMSEVFAILVFVVFAVVVPRSRGLTRLDSSQKTPPVQTLTLTLIQFITAAVRVLVVYLAFQVNQSSDQGMDDTKRKLLQFSVDWYY